MQAGAHAWIEKPPAASVAEVEQMLAAERQTGRFVQVGFKKRFFPAIAKVKAITLQPEFGAVSSIYARYPQTLRAPELRQDRKAMLGFLDHLFHPASIIHLLMGEVAALNYTWEPEFSLGQRYNNGLFLLSYAPEVLAFCESVLNNTPPGKAGLSDALALLRWYEAYTQPEGQWITL